MKRNDLSTFEMLLMAGGVLLVILLVLSIITSAMTGISMFDPEILKMISTIFIISLVILGILIAAAFIAAISMGGKSSPSRKSMLIKDNALRYEYRDGRRKLKRTFDLTNIDNYLYTYKEMYVIDGMRLYKEDPNKKSNALNLMVETTDGRKLSLRDLNDEDSDLYNRLAAFLDEIHEKDEIALSFHLRTYVNKESIVHAGEETIASLKSLKKQIEDKDIRNEIDRTVDNIDKAKGQIMDSDYDDKLRKLYDNYLTMLVGIVDNYETLERHQVEPAELAKAKNKLMETFDLINKAIIALDQSDNDADFDRLEASSESLDDIMKEEKKEVEVNA